MSDEFPRYLKFVERILLEGEGDSEAKSQHRRSFLMGTPGVREPKGRVKGYRVEVRAPKSTRKIWAGTFPDRMAAMRAYDATLFYTGKQPFYFIYPKSYFRPCPPGLDSASPGLDSARKFVQFVKRMAKEFSSNSQQLVRNPISELLEFCVAQAGGDGEKEAAMDFQSNLGSSAAAAFDPTPSSSEPLLKENLNPEEICLSSSSGSELSTDKGVEEAEVVSNPLPLFLVPDVKLHDQETAATAVCEETCFHRMDSPTPEDLANIFFSADDVVGVDGNLLGDSALDDLAPILFRADEVVEPASRKRKALWVPSFKVDAENSSGMPGADNLVRLDPCLDPVFRVDHNRSM